MSLFATGAVAFGSKKHAGSRDWNVQAKWAAITTQTGRLQNSRQTGAIKNYIRHERLVEIGLTKI